MRSLRRTVSFALALVLAHGVARADSTRTFEGDVPSGGPDHFFVPFDVPPGTAEIRVEHDDLSPTNILDFGLEDANGYRGWGGGTEEPIVVNAQAASRAYVPGPLDRGGMRVVVGKAKVVSSPAKYRIVITFLDKATLPPDPDRRPYEPGPALAVGARYYAGDFHVHSKESTDARPDLDEIARFARSRGLAFVELSDHNTVTQLELVSAARARNPGFLFVPGIEVTTYQGHGNAIGAQRFVEHKLAPGGATIEGTVDAVRAQGAVFGVNHPLLDLGDLCIGCAWKHEVAPEKIGAYEIGTGGQKEGARLFLDVTLRAWDTLLDRGSRAAPIGGSDDHQAGQAKGAFASPIGSPTTLVLADELSAAAIVEGVKRGRTVVKLQGPEDPMIELSGERGELPGDEVAVKSARVRARVTGGIGHKARFVTNGVPGPESEITTDPFELATVAVAEAGKRVRVRAEVLVDDKPRTVTSHIFVQLDPAGPEAAELASPEGTGGCTTEGRAPSYGVAPLVVALSALAAAWARARART
ncbi:MAG: CehA/McbA family metallohydrolase [Polyangiaceae bacterium]